MDELSTLRISTGALPGRDRVEAFREIFGRTILKIEMEPLAGAPLDIDMTLRALPGFGMASGRLSPMSNRHTSGLLDNDDLVLVLMQSGIGEARQRGRVAAINEGQALLTANEEVATFTGHVETRVINFRLSRTMLAPMLADPEAALLRPIPAETPALQLLAHYAGVVTDGPSLATPELRGAVVTHMHDLAALAIGGNRDGLEIAQRRGIRAARLHAVKSDIMENLGRPGLTTTTMAARHGVTPRYVRLLFEREGMTFSQFVLEQRLAKAQRMLADPHLAERPIMTIAFEVGFGDLSYFNRAFRRRYGITPSDLRERAGRTGDS
ncbi:MAG TPA: AraC family transcriptional regulator [Xanthobacteraceae bacterium]